MKRMTMLMSKELDGDITPSEEVELKRAEWTDGEFRRERRGWQRTRAAFEALQAGTPKIPVDQWAKRVHTEARPRSFLSRLFLSVDGHQLRGWTFGACGLATTAVLLAVLWPSVTPPPTALSDASAWDGRSAADSAPVEVRLTTPLADESDDAPVAIRF